MAVVTIVERSMSVLAVSLILALLYWLWQPSGPPPFAERGLYAWIRRPIMAGFRIMLWAAPVMTIGHLICAVAATGHIRADSGALGSAK